MSFPDAMLAPLARHPASSAWLGWRLPRPAPPTLVQFPSMPLNRRQLLASLSAGVAWGAAGCRPQSAADSNAKAAAPRPYRQSNGEPDWRAVRALFSLTPTWTHFASFLLASHPRPVADAIERFRLKLDEEPGWIEDAAFSEADGKPFSAVKRVLAEYVGGRPEELCLTSNTTGALAVAYHGLRIRADQEILTTEPDHYGQHESIRYAAARSGCGVRYVALYRRPADSRAQDMVEKLAGAIGPKTRAVGVTWVHSSTGVKVPVAAMAEAVARANRGRASADRCLLIVDGVHGFGNQDVDVAKLGGDFFAAG